MLCVCVRESIYVISTLWPPHTLFSHIWQRSLPKDKIIFQDEGDSAGPRYDIAVAQDNNGGSWYAVVPKIPEMNHYFRTMRSTDKAQQRNVNRDHYLRSM